MDSITWQPGVTLEQMEKHIILKAYRFFSFNKTQTAASLGIAIRTLDSKLEEYKKESEDAEQKGKQELQPNTGYQVSERERIFNSRMEAATRLQKADGPYGDNPQGGLRVQPASEVPAKPTLPVQEPKEVQGLPSQSNADGGKKGNGGSVSKGHGKSGDSRVRS